MKRALVLLKPYRIHMAVAWGLMLIELLVELIHPLFLAKIIDEGVTPKDSSVVILYGSVMVVLSLIAFIAGIINSFFSAHVSQSYGFDLREYLFEKIQSFSFANFNQFPTSSLITRMTNDVTQLQTTVFMSLRIMLRAPLLVIGSMVMAFIVNAKLALILIVTIPILLPFLLWILKSGGMLFRLVQEKLDSVNGVMRENLSGMRLIRAFLRQDYEVKRFTKVNKDLMDNTISALRFMQTIMPVLLLVMNIAILGVLWVGHLQLTNNEIKMGEIVAIVNYGMRMTAAFSMLTFIIMAFSRARASANRISLVLETTVDIVDSIDYGDGTINKLNGDVAFEDVSFNYPNTNDTVLHDISFSVPQGKTVAILGATGSGKSSLFQLIPRLYDVTKGCVRVDGKDVRSIKQDELRKQIGYVPQESLLFTGTIRENIAWGKEDATLLEMEKATQDAQIYDTIIKLPNQFDTRIGQKGINLSGGQKQRIAIARALIRQPKILLLDDSTSALDLKTESRLLEAIKKYSCTTLIITQKITTAMAADQILILEDGRLIAEGHHAELLKRSSLYQQIYQSQFGEDESKHA